MDDQETISDLVENFLSKEWNKVSEEKRLLQKLLDQLVEQQNCLPTNNVEEKASIENRISKPASFCDSQTIILKESNKIQESKKSIHEEKVYRYTNDQYKPQSREVEKERLAYIFETSSHFLNQICKQDRCKKLQENDQHYQHSDSFFEKENVNPDYCISPHRTDRSNWFYFFKNWNRKDDNIRTMVRFGEFSPLNPAFRYSGKPYLGLGEYEERRKIFLNKKKREYQQYLMNAKNNRLSKLTRSNSLRERTCTTENNSETSWEPGSVTSQMSSPSRENLSPERTQGFIKWQQEAYRKELDKQVEEKRKAKQQQKDKEKKECENYSFQEMSQRKNLTKSIENEFQRRLNHYDNDEFYNRAKERGQEQPGSIHNEVCDVLTELDSRVTSRIKSPILKHNTESCAVENIEAYQKIKQELYKKELTKQIEEKKRLEEERKAKELELEKKTDEKIQEEKEKLKREYEKEQADIAYRNHKKAELDKQLADNLCRIKKENDEKKKISKMKQAAKPISKKSTVYATNYKLNDTHATKSVSFLPHAFVYDIKTEAVPERNSDESKKTSDAVIIQAPYVLATKDIPEYCQYENACMASEGQENRSSSPILPAVRTKTILNSIQRTDEPVIPPGVSMSKEAKNRYVRDDKILSNLSEIRRKLLKNQCSTNY